MNKSFLLLGFLAVSGFASADALTVGLVDGFGHFLVVHDGGVGDLDSATHSIIVDPALLHATFDWMGPIASVNASTNNSSSDTSDRWLSTNSTIQASSAAHLFVAASDQDYLFPTSGSARAFSDSFTGIFNHANGSNKASMVAGIHTANHIFSVDNYLSIGPIASSGLKPNSFSADAGPKVFDNNLNPYSMSVQTETFFDGSNPVVSLSVFQDVQAVPEPVSMFALSAAVVVVARKRRKN